MMKVELSKRLIKKIYGFFFLEIYNFKPVNVLLVSKVLSQRVFCKVLCIHILLISCSVKTLQF